MLLVVVLLSVVGFVLFWLLVFLFFLAPGIPVGFVLLWLLVLLSFLAPGIPAGFVLLLVLLFFLAHGNLAGSQM